MLAALAAVLMAAGAAPARPPEALAANQVVHRAITRGERHSFRVPLSPGAFLSVAITSDHATPEVRLWPPAEPGAEAPSFLKRQHSHYPAQKLVALAPQGGEARLEVFCPGGTRGHYTLRLESRPPTGQDLLRLSAQTARAEARRLYRSSATVDQSLAKYREVAAAAEQLGDLTLLTDALSRLGLAQFDIADFPGAEATFATLLPRVHGHAALEADALYYRGMLHIYRGQTQAALSVFGRALPLARASRCPTLVAETLSGLAQVYSNAGDARTALGYYEQALPLVALQGDLYDEAGLTTKVGLGYLRQGRLAEARRLMTRALHIWRHEVRDDPQAMAITLTDLAHLYRRLGQPARALATATEATSVTELSDWVRTKALIEKAEAERELGRLDDAVTTAMAAHALLPKVKTRAAHWQVPALLGRLERDRGRLEEAQRWVEAAVAASEKERAELSSERLRDAYSGLTNDVYDLMVDVLMRRHAAAPEAGRAAAALEASERGRARSLRELLLEAQVALPGGPPPEVQAEEKRLREQLSAAEEAEAIRGLATEYEMVRARIRGAHPQYAAVMQALPLALPDLQRTVPAGTALLEYDLGPERSYLWVVTAAGLDSYALPGQDVIEPLARRLHQTLSGRQRARKGASAVERRRARARADAQAALDAARLSRLLLEPVRGLGDHQRLIVVPDGVLHYVPFAALPLPGARDGAPLLSRHEVLHLPSASVAALLGQRDGRAPRAVAAYADPVFEATDPRVHGAAAKPAPAAATVFSGSGLDLNVFQPDLTMDASRLPRLAYTRRLAEELTAGLADALVAVDFAANREAVTGGGLDQFRMVLFATHGVLNSEYPELSGIALSMVDEAGRTRDGFLRLQDIYHLKLAADLVVLGACETGLGQEVRGEGLVGLSRGFFYAGAARVLASLWKVDEQATVELIRELYRAAEKDGLSYPAALRRAQLRLREDPRFRSPYYWASFFLQGDR